MSIFFNLYHTDLGDYAWYEDNSGNETHTVGQKRPNGLGLYDMCGNVWEWVEDCYGDKYYGKSPQDNPCRYSNDGFWSVKTDVQRVQRGGSLRSRPMYARAANRAYDYPAVRKDNVGFRIAVYTLPLRTAINPKNITQGKQPAQEQQMSDAMNNGGFVPPKPSPQQSTAFAAPTEKPRQLMNSRFDKGKNWFKWVLYILGVVSAVKLLFAFGHHDTGGKIAETIVVFIGGLILFGGGAFALGWLTGAEPDSKKNTVGGSN